MSYKPKAAEGIVIERMHNGPAPLPSFLVKMNNSQLVLFNAITTVYDLWIELLNSANAMRADEQAAPDPEITLSMLPSSSRVDRREMQAREANEALNSLISVLLEECLDLDDHQPSSSGFILLSVERPSNLTLNGQKLHVRCLFSDSSHVNFTLQF